MKYNFTYSASVEQYLSNEMNAADKARFEREAGVNRKLLEELNLSRMIDDSLKNEDLIDFRKKLVAVYKKNDSVKQEIPVRRIQSRKIWLVAASIILLIGLGSIIYFNNLGSVSNDRLFKQYYSSDNLIDVTRAGEANIVEAVMKFQEKDFQSSSRLFGQLLEKDVNNNAGWFYYGISCIEVKSYAKAEEAFTRIIADNHNLYVEHAEWYLALCYLKSDQLSKAIPQLLKIATNPESYHRLEARHLLEKLTK